MSYVARVIARQLWAAMLWFMRRPWMKKLQRGSVKLFPEGDRRDRAWASFRRQERFARKYGLKILTVVVTLCLTSVVLLFAYSLIMRALEEGWLPSRETQAG